jgi:hypothetical protein
MMLIRYSNGPIRPAVLLALTGDTMRVALKDSDDVAEYRLVNNSWISEDFESVTFEFPLGVFEAIGMMPSPGGPVPRSPEEIALRPARRQ